MGFLDALVPGFHINPICDVSILGDMASVNTLLVGQLTFDDVALLPLGLPKLHFFFLEKAVY